MHFFTVGHSNHSTERLIALLRQHGVTALADARSQPYSRYSSQFNREVLKLDLEQVDITYVFLGDEIGGRPPEPEFYLPDDRVDYAALRVSGRFMRGISRLEEGADKYTVAVMCSEEDPAHCHRHHAVSKTLMDRGHDVDHIRGDGTLTDERELQERERADQVEQMSMFDEGGA